MRHRAIHILTLFFLHTFLSPVYAQSQIGEKTAGFITATLDGKLIALKDYCEQQGKKFWPCPSSPPGVNLVKRT